eukprot:gene15383-21469_t
MSVSSYQVAFPETFPSSCTISTIHTTDGSSEVVVRFGDILWDLFDAVCKLQTYEDICRTPEFLHISSVFGAHPHARYGLSLSSLMEDNFDKTAISWHCLESSGGTYLPDEDTVVFPTFDNFFRGVLELVEEIAKHSCNASTQERFVVFQRFFEKACRVVDVNDMSDHLGEFSIGCTRDY